MSQHNHISDELNELQSSLVTQARPGNGFAVPVGYFEGLASQLLARVQQLDELESLSPLLAAAPKTTPYSIPKGYFAELDPMAPNYGEEVSPLLAGLKNKKTFSLPEVYFERNRSLFAENDNLVLQDKEENDNPVLQDTDGNDNPAFADADENDNRAFADTELSPLLAGISRTMPNAVPAGYFAGLDPIAATQGQQSTGKLVRMDVSRWKRFAAAASVLLVVSLGIAIYQNRGSGLKNDLAHIPTEAIIDVAGDPATTASSTIDEADEEVIHQLVKNVPANEIQAFLNEVGTTESDMDDDPLLN